MKANEFIKKFGWEKTKEYIDQLNSELNKKGWRGFNHDEYINMRDDLKRYVDAYELVESYGGVDKAKIELSKQSILRWINPETEKLREAITLVEEM